MPLEVMYIATDTIDGQPFVMGKLGVERVGAKWFAVCLIGDRRYGDKQCDSREQARAECGSFQVAGNELLARHPITRNCRFRPVSS